MAEEKQGAYSELRAEVKKSTPILIDKLPKDVQDALRRQTMYKLSTGETIYKGQNGLTSMGAPRPLSEGVVTTRISQQEVPVSSNMQDRATIARAGLQGRTILTGPGKGWIPGWNREAFTVDADGEVGSVTSRILPGSSSKTIAGGPHVDTGFHQTTFADNQGKTMGAIRVSREGVKMPPKMASKGFSAAMNLGPMMYQLMTQDIDTDFTVKMIPKQFRKPDESGKMREAVVIVDGQPFVQYEGEPYNVPGYEDIGEDLAAYFRENSALSAGENKLGSDVGEGRASMEVRQSDDQALRKKVEAGTREAVKSTGPAKGGTPTFEDEYKVGKPAKEWKGPTGYDMLRDL